MINKLFLFLLTSAALGAATITAPFTLQWSTNDHTIHPSGLSQTFSNIISLDSIYLTPARGGVQRKLEDVLGDSLNILNYGADSTGVTNATTKVQRAYDEAENGDVIYFPRGRYLISSITTTNSKVVGFIGEVGSVLLHDASATNSMFSSGVDTNVATLYFENLILDGNKDNRTARVGDLINDCSLISLLSSYKELIAYHVVFTNSVRSCIRVAGKTLIDHCTFTAMNQHDGTNATFAIYAQPSVTGTESTITIRDSLFMASDTNTAALYKNPGGIFITEGTTAGNIYAKVLVDGNRFYGIGQNRAGTLLDPIRVYNGAAQVIVTHNFIEGFSYGGIGIQRCDDALIAGNIILRGENSIDNQTYGIFYTPLAREGSSPFTGSRTNENHYNCKIVNNIIKDVHGNGILTLGDYTDISGNTLESISAADDDTLQVITVAASNCDVKNNTIRKCARNALWISGAFTGVNIIGNRISSEGVTNAALCVVLLSISDSVVKDNRVDLDTGSLATAYYLSGVTNLTLDMNHSDNADVGMQIKDASKDITVLNGYSEGSTIPISISSDSTVYRFNNSDLPKFTFRQDTNGTFGPSIRNMETNTSALPYLGLNSANASGYIGAAATNYADNLRRGRLIVGADSSANGIVIYAPYANQTLNYIIGGSVQRFEVDINGPMLIQEALNSVMILDGLHNMRASGITTNELWQLKNIDGNIKTNLDAKQVSFSTSVGITNLNNVLIPLLVAGTGVTLTTNGNSIQISSSTVTVTNFTTFALSDMSTTITTGAKKQYWRAPYAATITGLRASLSTTSSSGDVTVNIKKNGTQITTTKLTIDAGETTSVTAAAPYVLSSTALADEDELTFDIDSAGTGAVGLQVKIYYTRP